MWNSAVVFALLSALSQNDAPRLLSGGATASERAIFADFIGLSARVTLECEVTETGSAQDCGLVDSVPAGAGFERVAMASAATMRFSPKVVDGLPVASRIRVPLTFRAPPPFPPYHGDEPAPETVEALLPLARFIVAEGGSGRIVADVDDDRRAEVQGWIDEVLPADPEGDARRIALRFARTLTPEQVQDIAAGRRPSGELPDFETLNGAEAPDPRLIAAGQELKRRYCAAYDCRNPFATETDDPVLGNAADTAN